MSSFFAVTFILNTVFSIQVYDGMPVVTEMCNINVDGFNQSLVEGSCKDEGKMLVETWMDKHPDKPWHLVVDGYDYNLM